MSLILVVCGFGLVILPGTTMRLGRSRRPSTWATMGTAALVGGAALTEIGLLLYATPTVLRAIGGTYLADFCQHTLDLLVPGGPWAGWLALGGSLVIAGGFTIGLCRARRTARYVRVESSLGTHEPLGDYELVRLPIDTAFAVSVAGRPGQVVVSKGLVESLTECELDVVLRHEAAHLDLRHQTLLTATSGIEHAFCFFPLVGRSGHALRCAVERWADEVATGRTPEDREPLRQALIKVTGSLITTTTTAIPALSGADTVTERLEALASAPREPSKFSLGLSIPPGPVLCGAATAGLGAILASAWSVIVMAGHCPL
jgi:hypothetical protein